MIDNSMGGLVSSLVEGITKMPRSPPFSSRGASGEVALICRDSGQSSGLLKHMDANAPWARSGG
jgi:hypothetical protein